MADRTNRREDILEAAARLFMEHGYKTTSVRQIAEQVGCTEAALYYHFPGGKRALFGEVAEQNMPTWVPLVTACRKAKSLHEFIVSVAKRLAQEAQTSGVSHLRWMVTEYPRLNQEERNILYKKNGIFRQALLEQVSRFEPDPVEAERLTWIFMFVMFGYASLMVNLGLQEAVSFDVNAFIYDLADRLSCGQVEQTRLDTRLNASVPEG